VTGSGLLGSPARGGRLLLDYPDGLPNCVLLAVRREDRAGALLHRRGPTPGDPPWGQTWRAVASTRGPPFALGCMPRLMAAWTTRCPRTLTATGLSCERSRRTRVLGTSPACSGLAWVRPRHMRHGRDVTSQSVDVSGSSRRHATGGLRAV